MRMRAGACGRARVRVGEQRERMRERVRVRVRVRVRACACVRACVRPSVHNVQLTEGSSTSPEAPGVQL